jgi:hypothetical protein
VPFGSIKLWACGWPTGAATATAELHVEHLGDKAVPHHITIKDPPHAGEQLQLP